MKRSAWIVALLVLGVLPLIAQVEDRALRVSFVPDIAPHSFRGPDGEPAGFYIDLISAIAEDRGWELEFVEGSWPENYRRGLEGDIDLLVAVNVTEERKEVLDFATEVVLTNWTQVVASAGITISSVLDLSGKTVAVMEGDQNAAAFRSFIQGFDLTVRELVFADFTHVLDAVERGEVDAGVISNMIDISDFPDVQRTDILLNAASATFATAKGHIPDVMAEISAELRRMKHDENSTYYTLLNRWYGFSVDKVTVVPPWLVPGAVVVGLTLVLSWILVRILTVKLRASNQKLGRLNEDLEEKVRIRSEELHRSLQEVYALENMASLGRMVAGVAHEVNTPVGVALTASSHLQSSIKRLKKEFDSDELTERSFAEFMEVAGESSRIIASNLLRAGSLIQDFKEISIDRNVEESRTINLKEYGERILQALSPSVKHKPITYTFEGEDANVQTMPGALSQIITNLFQNAVVHAFPDGREGTITIELRTDGENMVFLSVEDDGVGIAPDVRPRVFEPFFSSKRFKGSSGLGLSIVQGLVVNTLLGTIRLAPAPGARFEVRFPSTSAD